MLLVFYMLDFYKQFVKQCLVVAYCFGIFSIYPENFAKQPNNKSNKSPCPTYLPKTPKNVPIMSQTKPKNDLSRLLDY